MTVEHWIRVEIREILQGTDETFVSAARGPGGTLSGRVVLANGVGGTGGAQPPASAANHGAALVVDIEQDPVARSVARDGPSESVPHGMSLAAFAVRRDRHPSQYIDRSMVSMARHVEAMLIFRARDAVTFDEGNTMSAQAQRAGVKNVFDIQGFVPEYVPPRLL